MKNPGFKSTAEGFTLVEMCVVIAIFAILAAISIPNYVSWKPTYRLRQAANDMLSDFQSVRSQAIKRNAQCAVSLDQTVDGELYDYVGYVDENGDFTYDSDEEVLVRNRFDNYGSVSFIGDARSRPYWPMCMPVIMTSG